MVLKYTCGDGTEVYGPPYTEAEQQIAERAFIIQAKDVAYGAPKRNSFKAMANARQTPLNFRERFTHRRSA